MEAALFEASSVGAWPHGLARVVAFGRLAPMLTTAEVTGYDEEKNLAAVMRKIAPQLCQSIVREPGGERRLGVKAKRLSVTKRRLAGFGQSALS